MEDWDAHTMAHLARVLPGPIYTYRYRVTHGLAKMLCSVHPIVEEDVPFVLGRALGDLDDPGLWGRDRDVAKEMLGAYEYAVRCRRVRVRF